MEDAFAAKRQILVDSLTMCIERSKVTEQVDIKTIRSVLESGLSEMWREGELRLESFWKILCNQPGLGPREVAPPILAFKSFEQLLGVRVRLPPALAAIPQAEQTRLRDALGITRDDFARSIGEIKAAVEAEHAEKKSSVKLEDVASQAAEQTALPPAPLVIPADAPKKSRKILAIALSAVATVALGGTLFVLFRPPAKVDVTEFNSVLSLADARRDGDALIARLADGRWETLKAEDQERTASRVFSLAQEKGFKIMTLFDGEKRLRVTAWDANGIRQVRVH